jgi:alkanesulfonate monooxygenase SsuD/methylene tetrahydromethanopterin reductase-like flavin-dependent oxidoreductase (luciferase family)
VQPLDWLMRDIAWVLQAAHDAGCSESPSVKVRVREMVGDTDEQAWARAEASRNLMDSKPHRSTPAGAMVAARDGCQNIARG